VELLLSKEQVDVNAVNQDGNTPLHFATEQGSLETVKMLMARPEIKLGEISKRLYTPLDKAIRLNHKEIAKLLEEHGAPRNLR
jgi:ankyrin repeat protein